jgi:GDPmannose 4,6-dehydratase
LQQPEPEDYVIATGVTTSVRDFVRLAFAHAGVEVAFRGEGEKEVGYVAKVLDEGCKVIEGDVVVEVDKKYFRPTEVDLLLGDPTKAKQKLGWTSKYTLDQLAKEMVESDIEQFRKNVLLNESGFRTLNQYE